MLLASPALADQAKCESEQLKEISRYQKKLYKCLSKAVGDTSGAGECVASASNKFREKLQKTSKRAGCEVDTDFQALDLGLQTQMLADSAALQESLDFGYASIEPCEPNRADIYEVVLRQENELRVRVDTTNDAFYFDPDSTLTGLTNLQCIAGDRNVERLIEFEFECTFDPQGIVDPDGFCPEFTITSGTEQTCLITVLAEGSCEDSSRGDYRLEVFIDGQPGPFEKRSSNVVVTP